MNSNVPTNTEHLKDSLHEKFDLAEDMMQRLVEPARLKAHVQDINEQFDMLMKVPTENGHSSSKSQKPSWKDEWRQEKDEFDSRMKTSLESGVSPGAVNLSANEHVSPKASLYSGSCCSGTSSRASLRRHEANVKFKLAQLRFKLLSRKHEEEAELQARQTELQARQTELQTEMQAKQAEIDARRAMAEAKHKAELAELETRAWEEESVGSIHSSSSEYATVDKSGFNSTLPNGQQERYRTVDESTPRAPAADPPHPPSALPKCVPVQTHARPYVKIEHPTSIHSKDKAVKPKGPSNHYQPPNWNDAKYAPAMNYGLNERYYLRRDDRYLPRPEMMTFSGDPLEYWTFIRNFGTHVCNQVKLGPSLSPSTATNCMVHFVMTSETQKEIDCLWKTDFGEGTTVLDMPTSKEDRIAYDFMKENVRHVDGHFELPLPWRDPNSSLPFNRAMARKWLRFRFWPTSSGRDRCTSFCPTLSSGRNGF